MESKKMEHHIPSLDGLRGIAILLVLAEHFFNDQYIFQIGWTGVNLFFVLSGYLITGRLFYHDSSSAKSYFKNFYARRVLRIFPLYYAWLFCFFLVLPICYARYMQFYSQLFEDQIWYWLYVQNWNYIIKGYPGNVLLVPLWSLAVEEQFYIFWPFCFRYLKQFNRKLIIFSLLALSIGARILLADVRVAYLSTLTAFEPLLLGALICVFEMEGNLQKIRNFVFICTVFSVIGLTTILFINGNLTNSNCLLIKFGYSFIDCIWAFLLFYSVYTHKYSAYWNRLLAANWLARLGLYSYGIYIFHWIILQTVVFRCQLKMDNLAFNPVLSYLISRMAGILLVLACSYFSYHWYENRFLRLKKYFI